MKSKLIRLLELFTTLCIYALVLCGFCVLVIALTSVYLRLFLNTDLALIAVLVLLTLLFIGVCVIGYVLLSDKKDKDMRITSYGAFFEDRDIADEKENV